MRVTSIEGTYEGEPGENEIESLIQHLNMYPELPEDRVRRPVDVVEVERAVYRGEERAVEPAAPLRDQLWNLDGGSAHARYAQAREAHLIGHICHGIR